MKYLIWLLVLAGGALWWSASRRRAAKRAPPPAQPPSPSLPLAMTRCAHCGLHLPLADAIRREGRDFCSPGHAEAGAREAGP